MAEWGTSQWHKEHPIYLKKEDMDKNPVDLIESIRKDLVSVRGKLGDLQRVYTGFTLGTAHEGLTLVISYLYYQMEEMKKIDWKKK